MGKIEKKTYNLVFFRSKDMTDYYLLYNGNRSRKPKEMLQILNHVGEYWNSGYPHADCDLAYILETWHNTKELLFFIAEHVATNYIPHPQYHEWWDVCKGWYELKTYEPEKWLNAFEDHQNAQREEYRKNTQEGQQLTLF